MIQDKREIFRIKRNGNTSKYYWTVLSDEIKVNCFLFSEFYNFSGMKTDYQYNIKANTILKTDFINCMFNKLT